MANKIIMHDDKDKFIEELTTHVKQGWKLEGEGHGVKPDEQPDERGFYTQAVRKD